MTTPYGNIPVVPTKWDIIDKLGHLAVRFGIFRNNYAVKPGLYAVGSPGPLDNVLVTANYKLSFDYVRSGLQGYSAWLLVLDTKGVNVWCAAGKGTFGTEEVIQKLESSQLHQYITHRRIILPQLSATGVAAYEVKKRTGFSVTYGPVRAADIPEFIQNNFTATPKMRTINFTLNDRLVLIPIEIVHYALPIFVLAIILILISGIHPQAYSLFLHDILKIFTAVIVADFGGTLFTPLLLPWIPFRSFSGKGAIIGIIIAAIYILIFKGPLIENFAWLLIIPAISSFLAMNFTGSSTYTSPSGVKKEMKLAIPLQAAAFTIGFMLFCFAQFYLFFD